MHPRESFSSLELELYPVGIIHESSLISLGLADVMILRVNEKADHSTRSYVIQQQVSSNPRSISFVW